MKTSLRYSQKALKKVDFLYTTLQITVMWQVLKANKVSKIILKVVQEYFDNIFKEFYWFFLLPGIFLRLGGTPQMPLTVNEAC